MPSLEAAVITAATIITVGLPSGSSLARRHFGTTARPTIPIIRRTTIHPQSLRVRRRYTSSAGRLKQSRRHLRTVTGTTVGNPMRTTPTWSSVPGRGSACHHVQRRNNGSRAMSVFLRPLLVGAALSLAGCVSMPTGPSIAVLPGTGKSFDQFRADEGVCRQYAYDQIGGQTAAREQERSGVTSAVVGTAIGALAGAAIGGNSQGAAVGAGVGLLGGSLAGSSAAYASGSEAQRRYDIAYQQCMYAQGHRVPVAGRMAPSARIAPGPSGTYTPPPPPPPPTSSAYAPPPPPPGAPPPPPRSTW